MSYEHEPRAPMLRRILLSLLVIGSSGSMFGAGTFASYNATLNAPSTTFDTGVLVLSNHTPVTNTLCYSSDAAGGVDVNAKECDSFFSLPAHRPTDTVSSVNLTLTNAGDVDAARLVVVPTPPCANGSSPLAGYQGSGDLCARVRLVIEETDATFATPLGCRFGVPAGTACGFGPAATLATFATTFSPATPLELSAGVPAGSSRYYRISVVLPANVGDQTIQGRAASFGFTFELTS